MNSSCPRLIRVASILAALILTILGTCTATQQASAQTQTIYDDQLEGGWQNWGWATINLANTTPMHSGSDSIAVTDPSGYEAIWFNPGTNISTSGYVSVTFWIYDTSPSTQTVTVSGLSGSNTVNATVNLPVTPVANTWTKETVPLSSLGCANISNFAGFWIQNATGVAEPAYYLDDITLDSGVPAIPDGNISVDVSQNQHAISPQIYGVAFGDAADLSDMNLTVNRWGGNSTTGYNWQLDATQLGNDWYFESYPQNDGTVAKSSDDFITASLNGNSQAAITLTLIGWAANLGTNRSVLWSFSQAKYGAQAGHDPYNPDAGNGVLSPSNVDVTANNPNDSCVPITLSFEKGFVDHMISKFGTAANGGVKYYIMDNESSIWFGTHRDIHPNGPPMDEILGDIINTAGMVKTEDPTALVQGPEEFGWTGYFYSGADQQYGAANGWNISKLPDRAAHNGMDYMPYLLQSLQSYQSAHGTRLLDIFSLHYYPSGDNQGHDEFSSDTDAATELLRNKSTREFWDPNYTSVSWIGQPVYLIPRMKAWVNQYYPGTKLGITEYNWGDESTDYNCATAQADIWGIFGREGLDVGTRWTSPATDSPVYYAMKIYRNYDGKKSSFGNTSVLDTAPNPNDMSSFAAVRLSDGALTIVVINKLLSGTTPVNLSIANFANTGVAHVWQLSSTNPTIGQLTDLTVLSNAVSFTAPSESVTMLVIPPAPVVASPPTTQITLNGLAITPTQQGPYWYTAPVTASLTATDHSGTGIKATYYTLDGGSQQTYTNTFTVSGNASHVIKFWSVDNNNDTEAASTQDVNIDSTLPVTNATLSGTLGNNGWYTSTVSITLNATDSASGVASTYYTIDGGAQQTYAGQFSVTGDAIHTLTYWSVSEAGTTEAKHILAIDIDSTAPVTTATVNGMRSISGSFGNPVTVSLNPTDNLSGVASTTYTLDSGAPATYSTAISVSGLGSHSVVYNSIDIAGNTEVSKTLNFKLTTAILHTFASGLQMIGAPESYTNMTLSQIFDAKVIEATWNPLTSVYSVTPTPPANGIMAGEGYWALIPTGGADLLAIGTPTNTAQPFSYSLQAGWNLISDPFSTPIALSNMTTLTSTGASNPVEGTASIVYSNLYTYGPGASAYTVIDSGNLQPFAGYWIYADQNCSLVFAAPGATG